MAEYIFILFAMIFMHIVDDFYLQGILAKMKQKDWWKKQDGYRSFYKNDYIAALLAHGFSWSFMIMLPFIIFGFMHWSILFLICFNAPLHAYIDHCKANRKEINLIADQVCHLNQILGTWFIILWVV